MPELPEVETVKRALQKNIVSKKITGIIVNKGRVIKEPAIETFKRGLIGETIEEVRRRAKVLIIKLREDKFLVIHLRISGWLLYGKLQDKVRVAFKLSDGKYLNYMDQRLLGELRLRKSYEDLKFIQNLGPEPFDISAREFKKILATRKTKIKILLMNQGIIAGLGNIYVQEALFLAKIDPQRAANNLTDNEMELLFKKIIAVLKEAIANKGSSVDTYRRLDGEKGGMEKRLKVYGREKELCVICKKPLKKISLGGRGTCFCPYCQQ